MVKSQQKDSVSNPVCQPILLIHGVGMRDDLIWRYWADLPKHLSSCGYQVFLSGHDAMGSVRSCADQLCARIKQVAAETGSSRIHLIAHSKGGLDARYCLANWSGPLPVASLTTLCTPHRGSAVMDRLLRMPRSLRHLLAWPVNLFFRLTGDQKPDFFQVMDDFSRAHMRDFNRQNPDRPEVSYRSFAAVSRPCWRAPLSSIGRKIIYTVEGENDGLVAVASASWRGFGGVLSNQGPRGVSHVGVITRKGLDLPVELNGCPCGSVADFFSSLLKTIVSGSKRPFIFPRI